MLVVLTIPTYTAVVLSTHLDPLSPGGSDNSGDAAEQLPASTSSVTRQPSDTSNENDV